MVHRSLSRELFSTPGAYKKSQHSMCSLWRSVHWKTNQMNNQKGNWFYSESLQSYRKPELRAKTNHTSTWYVLSSYENTQKQTNWMTKSKHICATLKQTIYSLTPNAVLLINIFTNSVSPAFVILDSQFPLSWMSGLKQRPLFPVK